MPFTKVPVVIGLTGSFGAGCSKIAERLRSRHEYASFSLSTILREEARKSGVDVSPAGHGLTPEQREALQNFGDERRRTMGSSYFAEVCVQRITSAQSNAHSTRLVIDSIRNPADVSLLRKQFPNLVLLGVLAPYEVRLQRCSATHNQVQFDAQERRDKGEGQPSHGQNVQGCIDEADYLISNAQHCSEPGQWEEHLWSKLVLFLRLVEESGNVTPTSPELYMGQAYAASLKSTCCKRRVGAVIVKGTSHLRTRLVYGQSPKQEMIKYEFLIATGWNDVPPDAKTCQRRGANEKAFCAKDEEVAAVIKGAYRFCPGCGEAINTSHATADFRCSRCNRRIAREFMPGRQLDLCPAVHAEESAILQAARLGGVPLVGTTLYTTTFPCLLCAKKIVDVGIERVVYAEPYPMEPSVRFLQEVGVDVLQYEGVTARSYFRLFS